ncbi:hypothetical protein BJV82DRAFT_596992 [Fennellomyces sp. T-0311]|nr:hypothetical protein BJV82DRAFT_596992 [Fennellomyces sp. T-0311]
MSQSPLEKAPTLSGGQHTNTHLPSARSSFSSFSHGDSNGRSLSALNIGSILNPVSSYESQDRMDDYGRSEPSLLFHSARSVAGTQYTNGVGDYASGANESEKRTNDESTTLKWQPVETPQDHGSTEHYLYPYRPDLPMLASSLEFINETPPPYDTLPRPSSAPMYTSSQSSNGFYYYYHYPTPESPNIHSSTPFFHDDSRKRSLPLDHATQPKRVRQNSDVVLASFPPPLMYHHPPQNQFYPPPSYVQPPPPPPPPKEKKKSKAKPVDGKPAKKGRPLKNPPVLDAGSSIPQPKKPKKRGRPPKSDAEKKTKPPTEKKKTVKKGTKTAASKKEDPVLYCTCQKPLESPMYMLSCDHCGRWFHGVCVHITRSEGDFLDLYYCAECSNATGKQSTLRPPCANPACDNPARLCTKGKERSKYCSDACGIQVARERLDRAQRAYLADNPKPQTMEQTMKAMLQSQQQGKSQLNIDSNAWDMHRLALMKTERIKARGIVKFVDIQAQFLTCVKESLDQANNEPKICGYDSRLAWQSSVWHAIKSISRDGTDIKVEFVNNVDGADQFTVCTKTGKCPKHDQWHILREAELSSERKTQINLLTMLDRKRKQLKSRIHQRLQQPEGWTFLENGTICHD